MKKENSRNIRLGLVVLLGSVCIIAALYYIGSRQRLFGSTIQIKAAFYNVSGLRRGNSVRFTGIDIGTVESIEIISDTSVLVIMAVDSDVCRFIRKDALAIIGTDGVMGNKLVNIYASRSNAPRIENGDMLKAVKTVEMDATFRTLNNTNDNLNVVSADLRSMTEKLNGDQSLLHLLLDRSVSDNLRSTIAHFTYTGENTAVLTGDLRAIVHNIRDGKGTAGLLLTDTSFRNNFVNSAINIQTLTDSLVVVTGDFQSLAGELKNGEGLVNVLFTDTAYVRKLKNILLQLENGAGGFDESMSNLKRRWPFKAKRKHTVPNQY